MFAYKMRTFSCITYHTATEVMYCYAVPLNADMTAILTIGRIIFNTVVQTEISTWWLKKKKVCARIFFEDKSSFLGLSI